MRIYNDLFVWEGWGGLFKLGHGHCHLQLFDLRRLGAAGPSPLRPYVVIVQDAPGSPLSMRSCAGHIATVIAARFHIEPQRMLYVEHYPERRYGTANEHVIAERFDAGEFTWQEGKALFPHWRTLPPALCAQLKMLMSTP